MASVIDWYLIELARRIGRRLPTERQFTTLAEVEVHLRSRAAELAESGMSPELSERAAVQSFGRLDDVALEVVEAETAPHVRQRWRWAWIASVLLAYVCLITTVMAPPFEGGIVTATALSFLIPVLLITSAGARRMDWRFILAPIFPVFLALLAIRPTRFAFDGVGLVSRPQLVYEIQSESERQAQLQGGLNKLATYGTLPLNQRRNFLETLGNSASGYLVPNKNEPFSFSAPVNTGWRSRGLFAPMVSYGYYYPYSRETVSSAAQALLIWDSLHKESLELTRHELLSSNAQLNRLTALQQQPIRLQWPHAVVAAAATSMLWLGIWLFSLIGVHVGTLFRKVTMRRSALA